MGLPEPVPRGTAPTPETTPDGQRPDLQAVPDLTAASPAGEAAGHAAPAAEEGHDSGPGLLEGLAAHLRPPDVFTTPIPSLAQQWQRLREGAHLPDTALPKALAIACAAVAALPGMAAVLLHWAAASPARMAAVAAGAAALWVLGATAADAVTDLL